MVSISRTGFLNARPAEFVPNPIIVLTPFMIIFKKEKKRPFVISDSREDNECDTENNGVFIAVAKASGYNVD